MLAEALEQLFVGGVKLKRIEPGITSIGKLLLLGVNVTEMLVEHRIVSGEPNSALHLCQGFGERARFKQGPGETIDIVPIARFERDRPRGQGKGLVDLDSPL